MNSQGIRLSLLSGTTHHNGQRLSLLTETTHHNGQRLSQLTETTHQKCQRLYLLTVGHRSTAPVSVSTDWDSTTQRLCLY